MRAPRRKFPRPAPALVAGMLAACGGAGNGAGGSGGMPPQQAPAVEFIAVEPVSVPVHAEYAGRVRGAREVEVRARVEGILEQRLYEEGRTVERGERLFRIEQAPFRIALQRAAAERQSARAELNRTERDWARISRLYDRDVASESQRDAALSAFEAAQARLAEAEAAVAAAELDLDYTSVSAPIGGVTSLEAFPEGTLVEPGTLLTRIVQLDPVHVRFDLPEADALQQAAARAIAGASEGATRREAELLLPDGRRHGTAGTVDFTSSTIDARTGTVTARAVFENARGRLVPGQFVRVRVRTRDLEDVFLVPQTAVGQSGGSASLFVLEGERLRSRAVELGPVVEGRQVVVSGLAAGDRVVASGRAGLREGMTVQPRPAAAEERGAGAERESG